MKKLIFVVIIFASLIIMIFNYEKIISVSKIKLKLSFVYDREKIYDELGLNKKIDIFYFFSNDFKNRIKKFEFVDSYNFFYSWFREVTIQIYHKEIISQIVINNEVYNLTIDGEIFKFQLKEEFPLIIIKDKIEKDNLKLLIKDLWVLKKKYYQIYQNISQIDILYNDYNTINLHFRTYSNYVTLKKNINVENIIESYLFISKTDSDFHNVNFIGFDGSYFVYHQE